MGAFSFRGLNLRKLIEAATNGTTANPPAFVLQITYALSAAA